MTVQELINHLQQFDSEATVMFSHTDHTDYVCKLDMNEDDVVLGDPISDDWDEDTEDLLDDDGNYIGPDVVLFTLNYEC